MTHQLPARHIDRNKRQRLALRLVLPDGEVAGRPFQHIQAERGDQPAVFRHWNDFRRRDWPALGMLPAQQRLVAGDRIVGQPHDRLIGKVDKVIVQRLAERRFQFQPVAIPAERRPVENHAVAALALGFESAGFGKP